MSGLIYPDGRPIETISAREKVSSSAPELLQIVQDSVRDRWQGLMLRGLTPERVRQILEGVWAGDLTAQWELFDLMEETWPRLLKNLNEVKRAVTGAKWSVTAYSDGDEDPSPEAEQRQAFVRHALWNYRPDVTRDENSVEEMVFDLCDAIGKAVSVQEILWHRSSYEGRPAILPRATQWVHPRYYGYPATLEDAYLQLRPDGFGGDDWMDFPANKFVIGIFKAKTGWVGSSALLRALATYWIGANFSYDWCLNLAQMFGIPLRWATYDPSQKGVKQTLCKMLENMGSAGWGAFPHGTTLEIHDAVSNAQNNPQSWVMEIADVACDLLILGQTLTGRGSDKGSGSRALGEVHMSVRADVIEYMAEWVCGVVNYQLIPAIVELNYGDQEELPELKIARQTKVDPKELAERDKVLQAIGVPMPKQWFYDRHEVPVPDDDEEVIGGGSAMEGERTKPTDPPAIVRTKAKDAATEKVIGYMLENITGIEEKWLAGVRPSFVMLLDLARDTQVSDAQLVRSIESMVAQMPELASAMRSDLLADELERAMTAGLLNGMAEPAARLRRIQNRKEGA